MAQESDIPSRIIKEHSDIFGEYQLSSFNDAINKSYLPFLTSMFQTGN